MERNVEAINNLTENEKQAVGELVEGLKKLYGNNLSRVILYGSKARGDSEPESDIDILVALKKMELKDEDKMSKLVAGICLNHDLYLEVISVREELILAEEKTLFMENVLNEGMAL